VNTIEPVPFFAFLSFVVILIAIGVRNTYRDLHPVRPQYCERCGCPLITGSTDPTISFDPLTGVGTATSYNLITCSKYEWISPFDSIKQHTRIVFDKPVYEVVKSECA